MVSRWIGNPQNGTFEIDEGWTEPDHTAMPTGFHFDLKNFTLLKRLNDFLAKPATRVLRSIRLGPFVKPCVRSQSPALRALHFFPIEPPNQFLNSWGIPFQIIPMDGNINRLSPKTDRQKRPTIIRTWHDIDLGRLRQTKFQAADRVQKRFITRGYIAVSKTGFFCETQPVLPHHQRAGSHFFKTPENFAA